MSIKCAILKLYDCILQMTGKVNYDVWHWIIGYTVDDMRIKRSFPNHPDVNSLTMGIII